MSFDRKHLLGTLSNVDKMRGVAAGVTVGSLTAAAVSGIVEHVSFVLREKTLAVLPPKSTSLRILHISDIHMSPGQLRKQQFIRRLSRLEPDLVVNTGDNLAHIGAGKYVVQALDQLLSCPGVFVFGSNDYYAPKLKNPLRYIWPKTHHGKPNVPRQELPWRDVRAAFIERGWEDVSNQRIEVTINGLKIVVAGVDDPHINRDRYDNISGLADRSADLRLGLTHSPEPRILDRFAEDGYNLVLAGHTHGGQLRLPGYGAIVTNCGLDRKKARGWSMWKNNGTQLHVSAGLGTSPYYPMRTFCKPEVTLLTLVGVSESSDERYDNRSHNFPETKILPAN